ncbi:MAG: CoA-transferase [Candidatus Hodarchaeales archaeon]|jgi:acyl CoA:acetate/3-ketoacid CoA transferase alpha subunit/acyl CoA:acetate/3-ketoacid CoA transferase beta subunit
MANILRDLENQLKIGKNSNAKKLVDLPNAVEKVFSDGKKLHFTCINALPYSSIREIIRQSVEKDNQFEVISLGAASQIQMLVTEGLVTKLVTSYAGDVYPRPGISPVFQRAFDDGLVIEQWSLLTLCLRLNAGALGMEFIPTTSIIGSTMEIDNKDSFKIISNPFDPDQSVAVVSKIEPDWSFVHAWVTDQQGNALIYPPYSENLWGCYASKKVLLTAEKIVDSNIIRELAGKHQCIMIPGSIVDFIAKSPFGGHPGSHHGPNGVGYDVDHDHLIDFRKSAKDINALLTWMKEWVHETDQESYLQKCGLPNLAASYGRLAAHYWKWSVIENKSKIMIEHPATPVEMMIWAATQIIEERVQENDYATILAGQGSSNLAAWLATYALRKNDHDVKLLAELGILGYLPKPSSPFIFDVNNLRSAITITDSITALGTILRTTKSIGVLGAGQIDQYGNINSTRVQTILLLGSGGANDVGSNAQEIIVLIPLRTGRFPAEIPYITVPGSKISVCITTEGIFEKLGSKTFKLTGYIGNATEKDQVIARIEESIEWDLDVKDPLKQFSPPTSSWLRFLRSFDPDRYFLGRIKNNSS